MNLSIPNLDMNHVKNRGPELQPLRGPLTLKAHEVRTID